MKNKRIKIFGIGAAVLMILVVIGSPVTSNTINLVDEIKEEQKQNEEIENDCPCQNQKRAVTHINLFDALWIHKWNLKDISNKPPYEIPEGLGISQTIYTDLNKIDIDFETGDYFISIGTEEYAGHHDLIVEFTKAGELSDLTSNFVLKENNEIIGDGIVQIEQRIVSEGGGGLIPYGVVKTVSMVTFNKYPTHEQLFFEIFDDIESEDNDIESYIQMLAEENSGRSIWFVPLIIAVIAALIGATASYILGTAGRSPRPTCVNGAEEVVVYKKPMRCYHTGTGEYSWGCQTIQKILKCIDGGWEVQKPLVQLDSTCDNPCPPLRP